MSANPLPEYRPSYRVSTRQPSHRREPPFAVCKRGMPIDANPSPLITYLSH
jgi:hypothetical protein